MRQVTNSRSKYSFEYAPYFVHLRMHTGKFFSGDGLLLVFEIAILCLWTPLVWEHPIVFISDVQRLSEWVLFSLSRPTFQQLLKASRPEHIVTALVLLILTYIHIHWKLFNCTAVIKSLQTNHIFGNFLTTTIAKRIHIYNLDNLLSMYTETWYLFKLKTCYPGMETRVKVILSRSRQQQQPVDDKAALVNKQPNFLQSFLNRSSDAVTVIMVCGHTYD